ncbi:MAG: RluA family pseudouridine synthase [Clostridia bacterium]|nr:RluA family pseudouridine synthase [Clostridia bacterium]
MKSFTINKNDSGQRMDKYLTKSFPNLPKSLMYKYIRLKRIKLNGKRTEISTRLNEGDLVELYINDEFLVKGEAHYDFMSASKSIDVVYEDDNIMLLNKKAGLLCHPDDSEYIDTLIGRIKRYLYEKGEYDPDAEESFTPALANRIDRNTAGIVIAAKNAQALRELNLIIKERMLDKYYLCVAHGKMPKKHELLEGYLFKDEKKNMVTVSGKFKEGSKQIRTEYTVLDYDGKLSLLEIKLLTGRTHQIRAHLACIGHPLLGDGKYGSNELNKETGYKKQCLCSYKLHFGPFSDEIHMLSYLDGKQFSLNDIWFKTEFQNRNL